MPIQPVISNNSPLVGLFGLNLLSLLRDLYTEVWIPRKVEKEFLKKDPIVRREALENAPWIKTVDLTDPQTAAIYVELNDGEAETLALANEHGARLVLLDEKVGRQTAEETGLTVKGTVGILLEAKVEGLIEVIKPLLIRLQDNGMPLSESLIHNVLQGAGETDELNLLLKTTQITIKAKHCYTYGNEKSQIRPLDCQNQSYLYQFRLDFLILLVLRHANIDA